MKAFFSSALIIVAATCSGQPVQGVVYGVTNVRSSPLFDITGEHGGTDGAVDVTMQVQHHASGRVTGTALAEYRDGYYDLWASGPIRARFTVPRGVPTVRFTFRAPIQGNASGTYRLVGTGSYVPEPPELIEGDAMGRACFDGRCYSSTGWFFIPAWETDWTLRMNITNMTTFTGVATLKMERDGRTFHYLARGRVNKKTGESVIKLSGYGGATGSRLVVTGEGAFRIATVTGKLLGQRVNLVEF